MTVVKRLKQLAVAAAVMLAFSAVILPAQATPPDENGDHKVWVCHTTDSDTNPYELINVDVAAWSAHEDHGDVYFFDTKPESEAVCYGDPF